MTTQPTSINRGDVVISELANSGASASYLVFEAGTSGSPYSFEGRDASRKALEKAKQLAGPRGIIKRKLSDGTVVELAQ